jgi:hypothetical protein
MQILSQIPVWVPFLFVFLLVLGLRARHRRHVPVVLIYSIPLLSLLSLRAVSNLPAGLWIWGVFAVCFSVGIWAGYRMQASWLIARQGRSIEVAGENVTLILLMAVFFGNFATGILTDVMPGALGGLAFQLTFTSLLSSASGVFAGRALYVLHVGRRG